MSVYGLYWLLIVLTVVFLITGAVLLIYQIRKHKLTRPVLVTITGNDAVPLRIDMPVSVGGAQCGLEAPGIPYDTVIGTIKRTKNPHQFELKPSADFNMQINGINALASDYRLGQPVCFEQKESKEHYNITIYPFRGKNPNIAGMTPDTYPHQSDFDDVFTGGSMDDSSQKSDFSI